MDHDDPRPTESLLAHEKSEYLQELDDAKTTKFSRTWATRRAHFLILYFVNAILVLTLFWHLLFPRDPTLALFSPANGVVEYETITFQAQRSARTLYMPPEEGGISNDSTDLAWEDLYKAGINKISRPEAAQLTNWTVPIPGDEKNYIVMLNVCHQLHCLNIVRRALYRERYNMTMWDGNHLREINNEHLEHCVDSLRQLTTCHSDVSTHYWRWEDWHKNPGTRVYAEVTHTCRNFEKIQDWAVEHRLRDFDFHTKVIDPLRPQGSQRIGHSVV